MCSINHDLKCVYLHTAKCGGSYVTDILEKFYNFKTFFFTSEHHDDFISNKTNNYNYCFNKGFFYIDKNMYRYFRYSNKFNLLTGMDDNKWETYFKFTFVRHPFDKFISAYKYLKLNEKNMEFINVLNNGIIKNNILNYYEYFHISIKTFDLLSNNDNKIEFNYVGRYEFLNKELIHILKLIGINEIKHTKCIFENIVINSSDNKKFISNIDSNHVNSIEKFLNNIDQDFIIKFNKYFLIDYEYFNYEKINLNNFKDFIQDKKKIVELNNEIIKNYDLNNNTPIHDDNSNIFKNEINSCDNLLRELMIISSDKNSNNKITKYI